MFGNTFEGLGAPKRSKKRKSRKGGSASCRAGIVKFKTKRGKVVSFRGKTGPGCGPRKKPTTRHLAPYKKKLASASKACGNRGLKRNQFQSCVASEMHKGGLGRRRHRR